MSQPQYVKIACETLIRRVRFEHAHLRLPGHDKLSDDDTAIIREVTCLYTESWIIPLIEAIRDSDEITCRLSV